MTTEPWRYTKSMSEIPPDEETARALRAMREGFERLDERDRQARRPTVLRNTRRAAGAIVLAGAAIAITLLALPGSETPEALARVHSAPQAARGEGSVRFVTRSTLDLPGRRPEMLIENATVDFARNAYHGTVRHNPAGGGLERISVGRSLWVRRLRTHDSHAPSWQRTLLAQPYVGFGYTGLSGLVLTNLPALFAALEHLQAPTTGLGSRLIGGTMVQGYRLRTTVAMIAKAMSDTVDVSHPDALSSTKATLDLWLDGKGRPRLESQVFDFGPESGSLMASTSFKYGSITKIIGPPATQTRVVRPPVRTPTSPLIEALESVLRAPRP